MSNIPDWITINPEINFGKPSENYATEIYLGGWEFGTNPEETMANEEDLDYDNFEHAKTDVNGATFYTYRKGDYDYLIIEFATVEGDYPMHYITLRQCHEAAPFKKEEI